LNATAVTPHTRVDNSIIDNLAATIGIYGLGIYVAIKRHLNQKTGDCYPSYQTIAKKLHIDRGTVIRYVKKLKAFNLLDPQLRFKEDGSPTSNQASQEQRPENVRLGSHERFNYRIFCCENGHIESSTSWGSTGVSGTVAE
jgi:hypothetical protein